MKENTTDSELIHLAGKHFSGEASAEESARLNELLTIPEYKNLFLELEKVWDGTEKVQGITQEDINAEWSRLRGQIRQTKKKSQFTYLKIAASVALVAVVGFILYFSNSSGNEQLLAVNIEEQTLFDGSIVTLNANSELSYPSEFTGGSREVELKGEAFFDVERDEKKPFIIHTSSFDVNVLGTSFSVRDRENETTANVIVASGSVSVSSNGKSIILEVGESGILDKETGRLFKMVNDDPNFLSWKTKSFTFDDIPLEEVVSSLNNAYQERIIITNSAISTCPVTVSFESQSLDSIMEILKATLNLNVQKTSKGIEISGQGC